MNNIGKTLIFLVLVLFSGCVAQKKFDELLAEKIKLESDYADLEDKLEAAETKISRLEDQVAKLEESNANQA